MGPLREQPRSSLPVGKAPLPPCRPISGFSAGSACLTPPPSGSDPCSAPACSSSSPPPRHWPGPLMIVVGPGRGRHCLLQRCGVGPAGRQVPGERRDLCLRPQAARGMAGLHRRLGICHRKDGVVRGHGADLRPLRGAGLRHAAGRRRRRGAHGGQPAGHHPHRPVDKDPARHRPWHPGVCGGGRHRGPASGTGRSRAQPRRRAAPGGSSRRRPDVLRVRRLRPDRHAGRRGEGSRPHHPAGHPGRAGGSVRDLSGTGRAAAVAPVRRGGWRNRGPRCSTPLRPPGWPPAPRWCRQAQPRPAWARCWH